MNLPIYLTAEALQEEAEAYLYYEDEREDLGERFLNEVERTLEKIAANPQHYSYSDDTKTIRDLSLKSFPFIIIYEVEVNRIKVYHIHNTNKELK